MSRYGDIKLTDAGAEAPRWNEVELQGKSATERDSETENVLRIFLSLWSIPLQTPILLGGSPCCI